MPRIGALQSLARFLQKLQLQAVILKEQPNQGPGDH
jgi:hypothetical protein